MPVPKLQQLCLLIDCPIILIGGKEDEKEGDAITAADPAKTEILGNYRTDYKKNPVVCHDYSWADHFFTNGHMQSECDPRVWSQIETLVRQRLSSPTISPSTSAKAFVEGSPRR